MDALVVFRYLEDLCGTDLRNYSNDKDFRRWAHKVIYYLQCYSLHVDGRVFINQDFQAYPEGPMVYSLHEELKKSMAKEELDKLLPGDNTRDPDLLEAVAIVLSKYSGSDLKEISHSSAAWIMTEQKKVIQPALMQSQFGSSLFEENFVKQVKTLYQARKQEQQLDEW